MGLGALPLVAAVPPFEAGTEPLLQCLSESSTQFETSCSFKTSSGSSDEPFNLSNTLSSKLCTYSLKVIFRPPLFAGAGVEEELVPLTPGVEWVIRLCRLGGG